MDLSRRARGMARRTLRDCINKGGTMKESVTLDKRAFIHIVDALLAVNASGLNSEIQQVVFDLSIKNAGGLIGLCQRAGLIQVERERGTPCVPSSMPS